MNNEKDYVVCGKDERFLPEHWGMNYSKRDALIHAQEWANTNNQPAWVWSVKTPADNQKPTVTILPYTVNIGDNFEIFRNQGYRTATVLAILDGEVLSEYYMDKSDTYALVLAPVAEVALAMQTRNFFFQAVRGDNVPHRNAPKKWLLAMNHCQSEWSRKTQGGQVPSASELLQEKFGIEV